MPSEANRGSRTGFSAVAVVFLVCALAACRKPAPAGLETRGAYEPGLGELMTFQQMRHLKLWLAGSAGNWDLAVYECEELGEGFDDVVRFHPTHKDAPIAPRDAIPRMVVEPLAEVRAAAERHDRAAFVRAYDTLTAACNNCHGAMNFGFNVVRRPTGNPYTNQIFDPEPPAEATP